MSTAKVSFLVNGFMDSVSFHSDLGPWQPLRQELCKARFSVTGFRQSKA